MDTVEQIKDRLDIKDVVEDYLKLQKSGVNFRARCPFHNEKTPSFFVSPSRQLWRCFGCGEGGDMFSFIEKMEGVEFKEALQRLASKAGVEVKAQDPKIKGQKIKSIEICELAAKYFHHQLESKNGKFVVEYFNSRGINSDSIRNFVLGYAPLRGKSFITFLKEKGYEYADMERAGLAFRSKISGEWALRFRGRIIFPIANTQGNIVGFGARQLTPDVAGKMGREVKKDAAKYINSPQTNVYDKGKILYGLDRAKIAIRREDACIVAEGYTDVILAHQAGYKNVVSASGTALTEDQLKLINRFTQNLILAFDMDVAGDTATRRGINLAQEMGFDVRIISMLQGKDPADIIKDNPQEWESALKNTKGILEFYFDSVFAKYDAKDPAGKGKITRELAPVLKSIANAVEQAHWVQALAAKLGVAPDDVWEEVKKAQNIQHRTGNMEHGIENKKPQKLTKKELLARQILLHALKNKDLYADIKTFLSQTTKKGQEFKILETLIDNAQNEMQNKEDKLLIDSLMFEADVKGGEWTKATLQHLLENYKKTVLQEDLRDLERKINLVEDSGNTQEAEELLKEFQQKSKKLSEFLYS